MHVLKKISLSTVLLLTMSFLFSPSNSQAQDITIDAGADLTSRFIYRGLDLGSSPQVQPRIGLIYEGFSFYLWGSHPFSTTPDGTDYKEVKFWMNYTFDFGEFLLTPQIENHFNANADLFDFDDQTTTHVFQASLRAAGKGEVAPDFLVGYAFWGPDGMEPTLYLEAGVSFMTSGIGLRPFLSTQYSEPGGFVDLGYEGDFVVTQIGLQAGRVIQISETARFPVGFMIAINPKTERAFTTFSVSF